MRRLEPGPRLLQQAARTNRVTVRFSSFCFQVSLPGVEQRAEKRAGRTKISCSGFLSPALALQGYLCQPGCQPGSQQTPDQRPGGAHTRTLRTCDPLKLQPRCLEKNLWSAGTLVHNLVLQQQKPGSIRFGLQAALLALRAEKEQHHSQNRGRTRAWSRLICGTTTTTIRRFRSLERNQTSHKLLPSGSAPAGGEPWIQSAANALHHLYPQTPSGRRPRSHLKQRSEVNRGGNHFQLTSRLFPRPPAGMCFSRLLHPEKLPSVLLPDHRSCCSRSAPVNGGVSKR